MRRTIFLLTLILLVSSIARSQTEAADNHSLAIQRCRGWQLSVKHFSDDAGAGQRYVVYAFKNKSAFTCTLSGFPSFALLNRHKHRMSGQTITHTSDPVTVVRLRPGRRAYFGIHYSSCSTGGTPPCKFSSYVRIKAPHDKRAFILREQFDPFELQVEVKPVMRNVP
jgi:hypothetical protein